MSEKIIKPETEVTENTAEVNSATAVDAPVEVASPDKNDDFKFFKCCSASLKRFSVIIFVVNIFISIAVLGVALVFIFLKAGLQMLSLLALPLITVFVILIVLSRFASALVYGFAEIVEKSEKK